MVDHPRSRQLLSLPGAILLSLVLATQVAAATWTNVEVAVRDDDSGEGAVGWSSGLVTVAPTTAIALYQVSSGIFLRRSTDSAATWGEPLQLSAFSDPEMYYPPPGRAAIAAKGSDVDVVWVEDWDVREDAHIRYSASHDGGASFSPAVPIISPVRGFPVEVAVARGPDDLLAVAWTRKYSGKYSVRVNISGDGGQTFGPASVLAKGDLLRDAKVAVGKGTIYVTYTARGSDGRYKLRVTRSVDAGASWRAPVTLSGNLGTADWYFDGPPSITAAGSRAFVGFAGMVNGNRRARYRGTTDRGATWSSAIDLSHRRSSSPVLALEDGVLHVAYVNCFDGGCGTTSRIKYRRKPAGSGLTSPESVGSPYGPALSGIGYAGKVIILYTQPPDGSCCYRWGVNALIRTP